MEKSKDLKIRAYNFSLDVIKFTNSLPSKPAVWIISDQVIRSATSIGANLNEAKGSGTRLEFKRFYEIALKTSNETFYWLNLLNDSRLVKSEELNSLISENKEIIKMISSAVITLKKSLTSSIKHPASNI